MTQETPKLGTTIHSVDIPGTSLESLAHRARDMGDRRVDVGWNR